MRRGLRLVLAGLALLALAAACGWPAPPGLLPELVALLVGLLPAGY